MRTLLALVTLSLLLAGCTTDDEGEGTNTETETGLPGGYPGRADECSDEVKEQSKPEGQIYGALNHQLENGLGENAVFVVEHLHESGCGLNAILVSLDDGVAVTLEYEDHLWDTDSRQIYYQGNEHISVQPVDWACSWHMAVTTGGLEDREEAKMCT